MNIVVEVVYITTILQLTCELLFFSLKPGFLTASVDSVLYFAYLCRRKSKSVAGSGCVRARPRSYSGKYSKSPSSIVVGLV